MVGQPGLALFSIEYFVETVDDLHFAAERVSVKGLPVGPIDINEGDQRQNDQQEGKPFFHGFIPLQ
jgi:hypothetical protein